MVFTNNMLVMLPSNNNHSKILIKVEDALRWYVGNIQFKDYICSTRYTEITKQHKIKDARDATKFNLWPTI